MGGFADPSNISNFFVSQLYAKGRLSIDQCARALHAKGEILHDSPVAQRQEDYTGFRMGLIAVVESLLDPPRYGYKQHAGPVFATQSSHQRPFRKEIQSV